MALVTCPECGHQVSTTAEACPQCGHNMEAHQTASRLGPNADPLYEQTFWERSLLKDGYRFRGLNPFNTGAWETWVIGIAGIAFIVVILMSIVTHPEQPMRVSHPHHTVSPPTSEGLGDDRIPIRPEDRTGARRTDPH